MGMDINKLVHVYTKIRDKRSEIKRFFEAEDAALKEQLTKLEGVLLKHLNDTNSDSIRTEAGTFYRQQDVTPSASDWSAFYDWIKQNDAFDALERRVKKTFVTEYMEANDGAIPPGVSVFRQYVVRVRKN
jgi:hypothetical protein